MGKALRFWLEGLFFVRVLTGAEEQLKCWGAVLLYLSKVSTSNFVSSDMIASTPRDAKRSICRGS